MIALKIKQKKQALYMLENEETKLTLNLLLEFYDVEEPKVNDYIIMHKKLLDRKSDLFTQPYAFELCKDKTFDEVKKLNDAEYALIVSDNKKYILKRVYG